MKLITLVLSLLIASSSLALADGLFNAGGVFNKATSGGGGGGTGNVGIGTVNYVAEYTGSTTVGPSNIVAVGGNVGIGSVTPGQKLDVQGSARFVGSGNATFSGNVGIGSLSPGKQLDVQGTIRTVNFTMTGNTPALGSIIKSDASGIGSWSQNIEQTSITIDGGGSTITTGFQSCKEYIVAGTITAWTMVSADAGSPTSGSITLDLWKDTYANYPPTVADTITASAKPAISSSTKNTDSTLTGWTTSVSAGDWICFNVDSVTSLKKVIFSLKLKRS